MLKYTNIGMDLGGYSMKVTAYIEKNNSLINEEYIMKSSMANFEDYFEEVRENLKLFNKKHKLTFTSLNISLPSDIDQHTNIGYADFPVNKKSIIQKAIGYEIQGNMNTNSINKYEYIWESVGSYTDEEGKTNNTMLYNVLSKDIIFELKKFTNVKTRIGNVLIQPICLKNKIDKNSIVIDFGFKNTRVYIFESGVLQNVEIIDFDKDVIDNTIKRITGYTHEDDISTIKEKCFMTNFSEEIEETEEMEDEFYYIDNDFSEEIDISERYNSEHDKYRNKYGLTDLYDDDDYEVSNVGNPFKTENEELVYNCSLAITDEILNLIQKIKQVVRSYELLNETEFDGFYVLGGLSNYINLKEVLTSEFSLDVMHLSQYMKFKNLALDEDNNKFIISSILTDNKSIKGVKALNFNKFTKFTVDIVPILVGMLCITMIVNGVAIKINKDYDAKIYELNTELDIVTTEANNSRQLTESIMREIQEVEALASSSSRIEIQKKWLSDIFIVLKEITPSELVIYKIDSKSNVLTFSGFSKNYSDIGFLGLALKDYGKVTIKEVNRSDETKFIERKEKHLEMKEEFVIVLEYEGELIKDNDGLSATKKTPRFADNHGENK